LFIAEADLDPTTTLMRMRIRILLFNLKNRESCSYETTKVVTKTLIKLAVIQNNDEDADRGDLMRVKIKNSKPSMPPKKGLGYLSQLPLS
jgi:hypothetical protein